MLPVPLSRSLTMMLHKTGASIDPLVSLAVTGLQLDFVQVIVILSTQPFRQFSYLVYLPSKSTSASVPFLSIHVPFQIPKTFFQEGLLISQEPDDKSASYICKI